MSRAIATALELVEAHKPELQDVLPRGYNLLPQDTLVELLRLLGGLGLEGDAFGKVYEHFLGNFALKEGRKGGVLVQSAAFVQRHHKSATREANTYYEDPHKAVGGNGGRFDFVMANPPFNVSGVDKDRLKDDRRFAHGMPSTDNANYLWIQLFAASLTVLFFDARPYFKQITRAIREFTPEKLEFLANIADVAGLRKAATLAQIEAQGRSLDPGRYVGVGARAADAFDFAERLEELNEELAVLNLEAHDLEAKIAPGVAGTLEGA